jgi:hypothetical protein
MRSLQRGILTILATWFLTILAVTVHVGSAWMPAAAFSSGLLVLLLWNPSWRDLLATLLLGLGAVLIYNIHGGTWRPSPGILIMAWLAFLGVGSMAWLCLNWLWAAPAERARLTPRLRCALFMPAMCTAAGIFLGLQALMTPLTYDRLLLACDMKYGTLVSWNIAGWFRSLPFLAVICKSVYYSLPAATGVCLVIEQRTSRAGISRVAQLQHVAAAVGIGGLALYQLCPATGPLLAFSAQFPRLLPQVLDLSPGWVVFTPRNAMPSLHMAAALTLMWNLRGRSRWLTSALLLYSGLTALATLGTGQHYLVDLVASPALVVAAQALCSRIDRSTRWIVFGLSGALTLGWIAAARSGFLLALPSAASMWILSAFVAGIPLALAAILEGRSAAVVVDIPASPLTVGVLERAPRIVFEKTNETA